MLQRTLIKRSTAALSSLSALQQNLVAPGAHKIEENDNNQALRCYSQGLNFTEDVSKNVASLAIRTLKQLGDAPNIISSMSGKMSEMDPERRQRLITRANLYAGEIPQPLVLVWATHSFLACLQELVRAIPLDELRVQPWFLDLLHVVRRATGSIVPGSTFASSAALVDQDASDSASETGRVSVEALLNKFVSLSLPPTGIEAIDSQKLPSGDDVSSSSSSSSSTVAVTWDNLMELPLFSSLVAVVLEAVPELAMPFKDLGLLPLSGSPYPGAGEVPAHAPLVEETALKLAGVLSTSLVSSLGAEDAAAARALAAALGLGDVALTVLAEAAVADVEKLKSLLDENSTEAAVKLARHIAIATGHGLFLATAASKEVAALSEVEAATLAAQAGKYHVLGSPLAESLLRGSSACQDSAAATDSSSTLTHDQLLTLTRDEKHALLWCLASQNKLRAACKRVVTALRVASLDRAAAAAETSEGLLSAAAMMKLEHDIAEFDLVRERFLPGPDLPEAAYDTPLAAAGLPAPEILAGFYSALSRDEQVMYNGCYGLASFGASTAPGAAVGAKASQIHASLLEGFQHREDGVQFGLNEELPASFGQWISEVKGLIIEAPVPLLGLLSKFVTCKIDDGCAADALESQARLRLLAAEISADLLRRHESRVGGSGSGSGSGSAMSHAKAAGDVEKEDLAVSPWWQRSLAPSAADSASYSALRGSTSSSSSSSSSSSLPTSSNSTPPIVAMPEDDPVVRVLEVLLGQKGAAEFGSWISAVALRAREAANPPPPSRRNADPPSLIAEDGTGRRLSPYEILADEHRLMDLERYVSMGQAADLHLELTASPLPWASPAVHSPPGAFLDEMRDKLNQYLLATNLSPLSAAEWAAYRGWALEEFAEKRSIQEEERLRAGESGFFNPRADEVYLQALLDAAVPPQAPLREQAARYLETVNRNKTWTFAKKRHMIQRLGELSKHLKENPVEMYQGSPFAALFQGGAAGGKAKAPVMVPKLSKKLPVHALESPESPELPAGFKPAASAQIP